MEITQEEIDWIEYNKPENTLKRLADEENGIYPFGKNLDKGFHFLHYGHYGFTSRENRDKYINGRDLIWKEPFQTFENFSLELPYILDCKAEPTDNYFPQDQHFKHFPR